MENLVESTIEKPEKIPPTGRDKPPAYNGITNQKTASFAPHKSIKKINCKKWQMKNAKHLLSN